MRNSPVEHRRRKWLISLIRSTSTGPTAVVLMSLYSTNSSVFDHQSRGRMTPSAVSATRRVGVRTHSQSHQTPEANPAQPTTQPNATPAQPTTPSALSVTATWYVPARKAPPDNVK